MSKHKPRRLDFVIDKLSSSIEHIGTGKIFDTRLVQLYPSDSDKISSLDWQFDWIQELGSNDREVYALTTLEEPSIIQGLISISDGHDHIFMNLLEAADFNKGSSKQYDGVAGNLVAFACHRSFQCGYNGVVSFFSKTKLVEYYEKFIGAKRIAGIRMFIDTDVALRYVNQYHKSLHYV